MKKINRLLATTCCIMPLLVQSLRAEDVLMSLVNNSDAQLVQDANPMPKIPASDSAGADASQSAPDAVELAALYYYAEQKQDDRLQREAARLSAKYPGFVLPADLNQPAALRGVDETKLWALFDRNDFAGIDTEIVRIKGEKPEWNPSADFSAKLERKKQRVAIETAVKTGDWSTVITMGATLDPNTETDFDLIWNLIDAYHETGMQDALLPLYRGILFREGKERANDAVLITTIQKAIRDFPVSDIRAVMDKIATTPAMKLALKDVSVDLIRKDIGEFNADINRKDLVADTDLARFETAALKGGKAEDFGLLGWYALKITKPADAENWFEKALAAKADENNAKGLYLSLLQQKKDDEAWATASAHMSELQADPEFLMNALSIRFARPDATGINADIVSAYSATILSTLSAPHAEILGWYAYNSKQYEASEAWFAKSIAWEPSADRVKGLALSYQKEGKKEELAALKDKTLSTFPAVWDDIKASGSAVAKADMAPQKAVSQASYLKSFQAKNFSACLSDLQNQEAKGRLGTDAQLVKGWCLMGLNRLAEARDAFAPALSASGKTRDDAAYGTALTLLRGKLTDDAEATLSAFPMSLGRQNEIRAEIFWQRARSAFDHKQYQRVLDALNARLAIAPEPSSMSQLRAWSHYNLGNKAEARAIFERLNLHMADAGIARGLNTLSTTPTQ